MKKSVTLILILLFCFSTAQKKIINSSNFLIENKSVKRGSLPMEEVVNFHQPLLLNHNIKFPNKYDYNDISLFFVSMAEEDNSELLSIKSKETHFFSKMIKGIDSLAIKNFPIPSILSYIESVPYGEKLQKGKGEFEFKEDALFYEILTFNSAVSKNEKDIIESYLAMKYGVTLAKDYINSKKDTIWFLGKNEGFDNNILCIGRDNRTGLNQKQSNNNEKSFAFGLGTSLSELNFENENEIVNGHFLFISDNGKLGTSDGNVETYTERVWKASSQQSLFKEEISFEFDYSKILNTELENNQTIWLVINRDVTAKKGIDLSNGDFVEVSTIEDKKAIFSGLDISEYGEEFIFSIIKAPHFFATKEFIEKDCYDKSLTINPIGGIGSYTFELSNIGTNTSQIKYSSDKVNFENLEFGEYRLNITDANGIIFTETFLYNSENANITSLSYDFITTDKNPLILSAKDYLPDNITSYWWETNSSESISKDIITIKNDGEYYLNFINPGGCLEKVNFSVKKDSQNILDNASIALYPNPVKSASPFTVDIRLDEKTDINLKIYASNGQLVFTKKFKNQKDLKFNHQLTSTGEYYILLETDSDSKTFKILIQ